MITKEKILAILKDYKLEKDFFVVDVLINLNNNIKIYIDKEKGVSIGECVKVSRCVEEKLLSEDLDFSLEVSSPGLDMPLKVQEQYKKNIGNKIEIVEISGEKRKGVLLAYDDKSLTIRKEAEGKTKKSRKPNQEKDPQTDYKILMDHIKSTKILISLGNK